MSYKSFVGTMTELSEPEVVLVFALNARAKKDLSHAEFQMIENSVAEDTSEYRRELLTWMSDRVGHSPVLFIRTLLD